MTFSIFDSTVDIENKSKKFLEFLVSQSNSIVSYFEPIFSNGKIEDFQLKFISENICRYTLTDYHELIGQKVSQTFPTVMENGVFEIWRACYNRSDLPIEYSRQFEFHDKKIWFRNRAVKESNGILVVSEDVTALMEAKLQMEELYRQLEFQNTIMNDSQKSAKSASYRWFIKSQLWDFSKNIHALFPKAAPIRLKEDGIFTLMKEEDAQRLTLEIEHCLKDNRGQIEPFHFTLVDTDGTRKHYVFTGNFMPVSHGQLMVGKIQDNTTLIEQRINLEKQNIKLQMINEELDSFNHIASHDLQEPLRKIRMFISRIQDDALEGDRTRLKDYIDKIDTSATRMQNLILQLLEYSKIGKKELQFEAVPLNEAFTEATLELESQIALSNADIKVPKLPTVQGVPILFKQLFINLLSNSIKYRQQETVPKIEVFVTKVANADGMGQDGVQIKIVDNGIGFDTENKEVIFGLFKRLHSKTEYPGTGVGLAICKKIVEFHKGTISATSKLGKGSEFVITLPLNPKE